MKKKTFLVSALSAFLLVLSACNGAVIDSSSSGSKSDSSTSSSQPTTSSGGGGSSSIAPSSSDEPSSSSQEESSSEEQPSSSQEESSSEEQPSSSQEESSSSESGSSSSEVVTQYTITYAAGEGTGIMNPVVVDAGSEHTLLPCGFTREGYHFDYWQVGNDAAHKAAGDKITVSGDVTVTAKWEIDSPAPAIKYTVSFLRGEGTGEMQSVEVNAGEEYTLPESTFTAPAGKEFKAWQVGTDTTERAVGYKFTVNADTEITALWKNEDVYVLYQNNGLVSTEIPLTKDGNAYTAEVTYTRGMYFTATKNGEPYALTAEDAAGNNVKVINDKVTAISNENATESIWVHTDEEHTVWLNGYVEEYFLTIGGIEAKLERNTAQTEFKEFYTPEAERFPTIHANETISITHDLANYEYTKNTGDTNNISPLDVHKVNNDATNVSAYLNVDAGTLLIGGYKPQYVLTVERAGNPILVKDFEHVDGTTYSTAFTFQADDIITGISKDGVVYDSLGVDSAEDNNAYLDNDDIKIHVYAPNAPIYLHDTDNPNIYVYKPSYIVTINDTPYTMAANGNTYFKEFDSLDAGATISFKHGTSDIEFTPEVKVGQTNNIKNDKTVYRTNDNVVLTLNVADVENYTAWLTGYYDIHQVTVSRSGVPVEGYIDLQLLPQDDGQYKLENLPVQKGDVLSFKLNGSDDTVTPIDDSESNNLTAEYKIRTTSEGVAVWINNNNKIYVDGFVHDYHVTVGTRQYEITLNTTEQEPFYEGVVATANKDEVVSMYIDDVKYVLTSKSGENNVYDKTPNTPTVCKTYNESTTNKVYITDLDTVNHTGNIWLDGYTSQYAVLINGVASGVTISKYDASSYTGTIPSVERGDILTFTLDGAPIDLISQVVDGNNVKDVAGDMKVRTNKENAEIWIHINANDVWLGGYVEEYTVTIGTNTYSLTKKAESTEWYKDDVNVHQGEAISVKHDGESFTVTRKADALGEQTQYINNIDTINLTIHNDAANVGVYVDVNSNTIYINGYQVIAADYDYYVSYNGGVTKTKMTPNNTGAPEGAEQYQAAISAVAETTVSFYRCYNEEYTLITTVSPDPGSNVKATANAGVFEVITTAAGAEYIYLKYFASSQTFKVWLGGYETEYRCGTNVMTKGTAADTKTQYSYEFAAATEVASTQFSFAKDRKVIDASLISIPAGQNVRRVGETNNFEIITPLTANTSVYLKLVGDNSYELYMGGYTKKIVLTVGEANISLTDNETYYSGSIPAAATDAEWSLVVDRLPVTIHAEDKIANNVKTVAGVTTVIREVVSATNVSIKTNGDVWCDGYYDLYDAYVGETKVATGVKTDEGLKISAEAGSIIRLKVNGGEDFANIYVKTPGDNNVKATDDPTKLLVIKTVVAGESDNMWINEGNNIWLSGYALEYNVQIGENHYLMTKSEDSEKGTDTWDEQYKLLAHDLTAGQVLIFNKDYNTKVGISSASGNLAKDGEGVITAKTTFTSDIYLKRYGENWVVWASCDDSYYLRGELNDWKSKAAYRFTKCTGGEAKVDGKDQYSLKDVVVTGEGDDLKFKAFSIDTYLPDGDDLAFPSAGTYDIYFAPDGGVSYKDWTDFDSRGYFYIAKHPEPQSLAVVVSGTVTEGNCVSGSNITITLTYDDASHEAVAADVEGIKYTLNGGAQIAYSTLVTTPLNATAQLRVVYRGVTSDPVAITVVEYVNNYTSVAIKDTAGTADYNGGALFVGDHYQATATGVKTDSEEEPTDSFVWSSSDETVATVTQAGYIVAVGAGTATITLASNANPSTVKDTCVITVSEHTYFTAKINDEGDAISFDPIDKSDSWVSHSEVNFKAGDTLAVYYDGVKQTYTAAVSAEDHNNLDGTEGILTAGKCYVYLNPTSETAGTIWVEGYARITYNGTSYAATHRFEENPENETYFIKVPVTSGTYVTAGVIGGANKVLTLDNGYENNLRVIDDKLTILSDAEEATIYMHDFDGYSVWATGYDDNKYSVNGVAAVNAMEHSEIPPEGVSDQYHKQLDAKAGDLITFYDNGFAITVSEATGNAEIRDGKVYILVDCDGCDLYLKKYSNNTYKLWASGLNGYYLRSKTGAFNASKVLVDTGETKHVDEHDYKQYVIKNVILANGDKINFFSESGYSMESDYTVPEAKAGTYDIYFVNEGGVEDWESGGKFYLDKKTLTATYNGVNLVVNEGKINKADIEAHLTFGVSGDELVENTALLDLYFEDALINTSTFTFSSTGNKTVQVRYVGLSANITIPVVNAQVHATGVTLNKTSATAYTDIQFELTATITPDGCTDPVTWESSDTTVATVLGGVVTPKKAGTATITVTVGDFDASCVVTVKEAGYYLVYQDSESNPVEVKLEAAGQDSSKHDQYKATISPKTGSTLSFSLNGSPITFNGEAGANLSDGKITSGGPNLDIYLKDFTAGNYSLWVNAPTYGLYLNNVLQDVTSNIPKGWESNKAVYIVNVAAADTTVKIMLGYDTTYTYDTKLSAGNYYVGLNGSNEVYATKLADNYYVKGDFNGWSATDSTKMTLTKYGYFEKVIETTEVDQKLKVNDGDKAWYGEGGTSDGDMNIGIVGTYLIKFYAIGNGSGKYIVCEPYSA